MECKQSQHIDLLFFFFLFFLAGCNNSTENYVLNKDLVFERSLKIDVNPYFYYNSDSGIIFQVLGDSALVADTVDEAPVFQWNAVPTDFITVVLSTAPFVANETDILNADNILWQWHQGMEEGKNGTVRYGQGKTVENKNILYDTQPLPLQSGLYYWTVYGWENGGREIIYSSKALKIYVK